MKRKKSKLLRKGMKNNRKGIRLSGPTILNTNKILFKSSIALKR